MSINLQEETKALLARKYLLEADLNKLLVDFHADTGIWVNSVRIDKSAHIMIGSVKPVVVDHCVKVTLDI